jgi:hypothetical protein
MLRWYHFFATLLLGGGCSRENLLLRFEDAHQSCSCWAWTPGGAILADFGRSKRAGDLGSSHPSPRST